MRAVNLLPRDEPKRRRVRLTVGVQLALVSPFVIASLVAAGVMLESSKINDNRATLKALQEELATLPPPTAPPQTNAQLALQQSQRVAALGSALQGRVAWDRILREISAVLPEDVWLTSLSATSPQSAVSSAPAPTPTPAPSDSTSLDGTTTTTDTTTTPVPTPAAPATAPLNISGYTYSQEGVARLMSRLAVIPELQDVKLVSSTTTTVSGHDIVQFAIEAGIRQQGVS
jgi:Tfp pilus assembly protein PilN